MELQTQLTLLLELAESIGIAIRRINRGDQGGGGGLVRLKGQEIVMLDVDSSLGEQIDVLARALAGRQQLEHRYLPPQVREALEAAGG